MKRGGYSNKQNEGSSSSGSKVDSVLVDGLVVLKIMKHVRENPHDTVTGPLLGLINSSNQLEITHSYPSPHNETDEHELKRFQEDMLRRLREVNVDHLQVGWYQVSNLSAFLTEDFVRAQFEYQTKVEESVVLIYDPVRTQHGTLALKAYRLSPACMNAMRTADFTPSNMKKLKLSYDSLLEEVPLVVTTSQLAKAYLAELDSEMHADGTFDRLDLNTQSYLEKNVKQLMASMDDLARENQSLQNYQKNKARAEQQKRQFLEKKKQENAQREREGLPALPIDDSHIKIPNPPNRLSTLLVSGQITHYCAQISQFANQSFGKLFVAQGLQPQSE